MNKFAYELGLRFGGLNKEAGKLDKLMSGLRRLTGTATTKARNMKYVPPFVANKARKANTTIQDNLNLNANYFTGLKKQLSHLKDKRLNTDPKTIDQMEAFIRDSKIEALSGNIGGAKKDLIDSARSLKKIQGVLSKMNQAPYAKKPLK